MAFFTLADSLQELVAAYRIAGALGDGSGLVEKARLKCRGIENAACVMVLQQASTASRN